MKVIEGLLKSIHSSSVYNPEVQVAPYCILWPDHDRQWEAVISKIQDLLPELLVLGEYNPEKRTGPSIWLRCILAKTISEVVLPQDKVPVIYLPGISRQDLRAVDSCPDYLKPLAELQYRGTIWSQMNSRDWSILAFLMSDQGGLGLDVAQDRGTLNAMLVSLNRLLDEDVEPLKGKRLDKEFFNTLLTSGDPVRDVLLLLDQGEAYRTGRELNEWNAFVEICKSQFAYDPINEGELAGVQKLASREGTWEVIWERYCEAPTRYPNIPSKIRRTPLPMDLFADQSGWPQWNESEEESLREELKRLQDLSPHQSRLQIRKLDERHQIRRTMVWAELGESPLAQSLEWLSLLAEITSKSLAGGTIEDVVTGYQNSGWKADDAVLKTLASVHKQVDIEAVTTAIRSVYLSWIDDLALYFQKLVKENGYPGKTALDQRRVSEGIEECIVFVDGLRYDAAKRLIEVLTSCGVNVNEDIRWAALPSVTATGKPAVTPVNHLITGNDMDTEFEPSVASTGQSLKGGYHLQKLLKDSGWEILRRGENGSPSTRAWCEFGDIDNEGHDRGWKLAQHLDSILKEIAEKIKQLLNAGWKRIRIVTDHGWLLMPGGLPKLDLPSSLTDSKWGRCAAIKTGAVTEESLYPWYWNPYHQFALASGVNCYRNGVEYTHGGLSLQECLTIDICINQQTTNIGLTSIDITDIVWKGMRCKVAVEGQFEELFLDIRLQAGNHQSSKVLSIKEFNDSGIASVVIEDEDLEGKEAFIVVMDKEGHLIAQATTIIGGGD